MPPSHAEFVRLSLAELAEEIVSGFDPSRPHKFRIEPLSKDSGHHWVIEMFAPFVERDGPETPVLRYRVTQADITLVKKTRRRFLGRFWVLRQLRIGLTIIYPWSHTSVEDDAVSFERTYTDWVPAADLDRLAGGEFSSLAVPPATDFVSRWAGPVVVGAGLGILTYLFFSVR